MKPTVRFLLFFFISICLPNPVPFLFGQTEVEGTGLPSEVRGAAQPIQPWAENTRYWQYRGQPVLITAPSDGHWLAVIVRPQD